MVYLNQVRKASIYVFCVVVGLFTAWTVAQFLQQLHPITIKSTNLTTGGLEPGDRIHLRIEVLDNRNCPGVTVRFLHRAAIDAEGKPLLDHNNQPIQQYVTVFDAVPPFINISPGSIFELYIRIPDDTPQGLWFYQSRTTIHCSWIAYIIGPSYRSSVDVPILVARQKG